MAKSKFNPEAASFVPYSTSPDGLNANAATITAQGQARQYRGQAIFASERNSHASGPIPLLPKLRKSVQNNSRKPTLEQSWSELEATFFKQQEELRKNYTGPLIVSTPVHVPHWDEFNVREQYLLVNWREMDNLTERDEEFLRKMKHGKTYINGAPDSIKMQWPKDWK
ncbi:hypothetical protein EJ04DRAFT_520037 [Polyplosphaeria fusca]|uniref:Uncharacterized protein n=1 Tax=Polyplosphaeria fusca TaxID=682080 RepID=A0A9P4R8C0_9PLEO|nr:hypothetical protein EJ04DRAFT_520037 [Polyplosphaeria fusca]